MAIKHAVEAAVHVVHPLEPGLHGIYGTIFTGPPSSDEAPTCGTSRSSRTPRSTDRRAAPGRARCWRCSTAMGCSARIRPFVHESIIGTRFRGRVIGETTVGDHPAIVPEIEGEAYITGENVFIIDESDPLRHGFRL